MKVISALIAQGKSVLASQHGATAIEYGLIVSLIALAAVGAMGSFGNSSGGMWEYVETKITKD